MKGIICLLVAVLLLAACSGGVSQEEHDRVLAERDALQSIVDEIEEAGALAVAVAAAVEEADPAAAAAHFAADAFYEDAAEGASVTGRFGIEGIFGTFVRPDQPIVNTAIYAGPGFVVTEWTWDLKCFFGTCKRQYGELVTVRGITLQIVEDGEVVRNTDYPAYSPGGY